MPSSNRFIATFSSTQELQEKDNTRTFPELLSMF